jgi:hypothetical protein
MRYLLIAVGFVLAGTGELPAAETDNPLLVAQDAARGCCVLRGDNTQCAYTSRAYCEQKARQSGSRFDFNEGTSCRNVAACR